MISSQNFSLNGTPTKGLSVRVTPQQFNEIKQTARRCGTNANVIVRCMIDAGVEMLREHLADPPAKAPHGIMELGEAVREHQKEMNGLVGEIKKLSEQYTDKEIKEAWRDVF